jgi:threonylcarbamoyladenosine tRNA methylthiotransferase MtaB
LDKVEGIERFRISSIEPNLLHEEIVSFVSSSQKFVPHFHIPLQSGCNKILKLMRRRYLRELYAERVEYIKSLIPDCCIGVDVIVGFPGESDEDFLETYNFINELNIAYLHVFTYSERANTLATEMENSVPMKTRHKRSKMLRILSEKKRRKFYEENIGKHKRVLFEEDIEDGYMHGYTENYIRVRAKYDPVLVNDVKSVQLVEVSPTGAMDVVESEVEILKH